MLAQIPSTGRSPTRCISRPASAAAAARADRIRRCPARSGLENQYMVDGVDITNPGYGGLGLVLDRARLAGHGRHVRLHPGSPGEDGWLRSAVRPGDRRRRHRRDQVGHEQAARHGVRLLAAGRVAEHVHAGDADHADAFRSGQRRPRRRPATSAPRSAGRAQDRLFYFAAIDPQWNRTTLRRAGGHSARQPRRAGPRAAHPGVFDQGHLADDRGASHRRVVLRRSRRTDRSGPQRRSSLLGDTTAAFSQLENFGGHNQTVRYSGVIKPTWLVEAAYARSTNGITETADVNRVPSTSSATSRDRRDRLITRTTPAMNQQLQAFGTNIVNVAGQHQIRYGVQDEHINYNNIVNYTGPTFTLSNGQQTVTGASGQHHDGSDVRLRSTASTRSNLNNVRTTRAGLSELLRAGHLADRPAADVASRRPLRAAEADRQRRPTTRSTATGRRASASRAIRPARGG